MFVSEEKVNLKQIKNNVTMWRTDSAGFYSTFLPVIQTQTEYDVRTLKIIKSLTC